MEWKRLDDPHPYAVVQVMPYDRTGKFLYLRRGANVRSAPNCLSFPSGLHECGLTLEQQAERELAEECGLTVVPSTWKPLFVYENVPGDGWHWVIAFGSMLVHDLSKAKNLEPDKHDELIVREADALLTREFLNGFHSSFVPHLLQYRVEMSNRVLKETYYNADRK